MSQWKVVVIVALLAGMFGYGYYQNGGTGAQGSTPAPVATPSVPEPRAELQPMMGKPAPAWSIGPEDWVNTPRPLTPQDLLGHITLIEFWRANCSHCQEAAPVMRGLYNEMKPRGLQMITFQSPGNIKDPTNSENHWDQVKEFIKTMALPYPIAFDKDGVLFKTKYHGQQYPTVFIVDTKGNISFYQVGFDAVKEVRLRNALQDALFKWQPPQQPKPVHGAPAPAPHPHQTS